MTYSDTEYVLGDLADTHDIYVYPEDDEATMTMGWRQPPETTYTQPGIYMIQIEKHIVKLRMPICCWE